MAEPTWSESLTSLRERTSVAAALANAATLAAARGHWWQAVIARTSMHDLLFTLPGDDFPFAAFVRVHWESGTSNVERWHEGQLVEEVATSVDDVDRTLDAVLERLVDRPICRRCGLPAVVSAEQFEIFERMHYVCFHYEFEHRLDMDEECTATGCPSACVAPAARLEEPRDGLVDEIVEALRTSELARESLEVRIDHFGPGVVQARFDSYAYLVSVRADHHRQS